ncbi:hypothetical protein ACU5AY_11495 [Rhizobium sp. PAMB 3174]
MFKPIKNMLHTWNELSAINQAVRASQVFAEELSSKAQRRKTVNDPAATVPL